MVWYGLFFFGYALDCYFVSPSMGLGRFLGGGKRAQLDFARGVGSRKGRSANRRGGASVFAMDLLLGNLFPFFWCVCVGDTYLFASGVLGISLDL